MTLPQTTNIINLTPDEVIIGDRKVPTSGTIAYMATVILPIGELDGIPLVYNCLGGVENLPSAEAGTWYIVSSIVAAASVGRKDLLTPSGLVRDELGQIVGWQALSRNIP